MLPCQPPLIPADNRAPVHQDHFNSINVLPVSSLFFRTVRDIDGNNVEEVVVFGVYADGRVRAQLLDALTGTRVARYFFNANVAPVVVAVIPSMNSNTSDDLVVLGINDAGKVRAEVIDSRTGKVLAKVTYDRGYPPLAMTYVEHPDGAALGCWARTQPANGG